jgi:hypothetical protein
VASDRIDLFLGLWIDVRRTGGGPVEGRGCSELRRICPSETSLRMTLAELAFLAQLGMRVGERTNTSASSSEYRVYTRSSTCAQPVAARTRHSQFSHNSQYSTSPFPGFWHPNHRWCLGKRSRRTVHDFISVSPLRRICHRTSVELCTLPPLSSLCTISLLV